MKHLMTLVEADGTETVVVRSGIPRIRFTLSTLKDDGELVLREFVLHTDGKYRERVDGDVDQRRTGGESAER